MNRSGLQCQLFALSIEVRMILLCKFYTNDLERPQTQILSSGHYLTLNISEMAKDTAIVTMEGE